MADCLFCKRFMHGLQVHARSKRSGPHCLTMGENTSNALRKMLFKVTHYISIILYVKYK